MVGGVISQLKDEFMEKIIFTPEEIKACWSLENLRPYSSKQNLLDRDRKDINV